MKKIYCPKCLGRKGLHQSGGRERAISFALAGLLFLPPAPIRRDSLTSLLFFNSKKIPKKF